MQSNGCAASMARTLRMRSGPSTPQGSRMTSKPRKGKPMPPDRPVVQARKDTEMTMTYHPDSEIDAGVRADALDAERADLAAGYPPRRWQCDCGAEHGRGHFQAVGVHRDRKSTRLNSSHLGI